MGLTMKESLYIILNQFKKEHINEDEVIQLIENLYGNRTYPTIYPIAYPTITYKEFPSYEVTCTQNSTVR